MKLFAVYLWGYIDGCHVEIHDVRFVIGEKIEDTYQQLQEQWIGWPQYFHIDAYMEIKNIDWYKVHLSKNEWQDSKKLFFVFMWAYDKKLFWELHEINFYVWEDEDSVKQRALSELCLGTELPHRDTLYDVDSIIEISKLWEYFIELEYTGEDPQDLSPDWFGFNTDVWIK